MSEAFIWSWSSSRSFQKCQRQWYYKTFVASHNAKDERRREAYLLSKLQSIYGWRGSLVDHVISKKIVPAFNSGRRITLSELLAYTRAVFNSQWDFAVQNSLRRPDFSVSDAGDAFAAFFAIEYEHEIKPEERERAWNEVELALTNFMAMEELLVILRSSVNLYAQCRLVFTLFDVNIRSVPDLIVFNNDSPPAIIDWKVNVFGTNDYRSQLATYALALSKNSSRADFPKSLSSFDPTQYRMFEVQLLTSQMREYSISRADIEDTEASIFHSASQMSLSQGDDLNRELKPFDFPVTSNPDQCQRCNFKSLCWKERNLWVDWKQMSLL